MRSRTWRPIDSIDTARMREARLQAHFAAQWLARAARAYIAATPDDSHTNLGWDDGFDGLVTHRLATGGRVGLKPSGLTLALLDDEPRPRIFALEGRTDGEARAWLVEQMSVRGLDAAALDAPSPYAMPPHAIAGGGRYSQSELQAELSALAAWLANADQSLGRVREQFAETHEATPVRCWPLTERVCSGSAGPRPLAHSWIHGGYRARAPYCRGTGSAGPSRGIPARRRRRRHQGPALKPDRGAGRAARDPAVFLLPS